MGFGEELSSLISETSFGPARRFRLNAESTILSTISDVRKRRSEETNVDRTYFQVDM